MCVGVCKGAQGMCELLNSKQSTHNKHTQRKHASKQTCRAGKPGSAAAGHPPVGGRSGPRVRLANAARRRRFEIPHENLGLGLMGDDKVR